MTRSYIANKMQKPQKLDTMHFSFSDVLEQASEDTDPNFAKNVRIFYESCTNTS